GLGQPCAQTAYANLVEDRDSRNIERQLQRATDRDHTLESQIEVFRRIVAVAARPVVDQRVRMNDAIFESKAVDERLLRRAWRAQRLRHVDLPGPARVKIVR